MRKIRTSGSIPPPPAAEGDGAAQENIRQAEEDIQFASILNDYLMGGRLHHPRRRPHRQCGQAGDMRVLFLLHANTSFKMGGSV
jgi:hypothetical protein